INRHGAVSTIEIVHGGYAATGSYGMGNTVYGPVASSNTARGITTVAEAMTEEIIERTIEKFYISAQTAVRWGFGMITIHGGHGWLLSQFMSPAINKRTDKWGGSFENNMRLPLAIVDAVGRAVGPGFPIEMRISGAECFEGGYDLDYGVRIAEALDGKVELIHVSVGSHENDDTFTITHPSMFLDDGCNVKYAAAVKARVKHSKVATVGALSDPEMMEEIIASGKADIVQMARGLICDPDIPIKARTGRESEIRHCMRCFACFGSLLHRGHIICALNPETSNELDFRFVKPQAEKKKVLIAGGGIAGMQAALTCKQRGHDVILCEKSGELGGILRCEKNVPFKRHLDRYLDYQANLVKKENIDLRLNTEVTPDYVSKIAPDVIIAALGAVPSVPAIPGIDGKNVLSVTDCYSNPEKSGDKVVILGGGLSGTELAVYLTKHLGRSCTIMEMEPQLGNGGNRIHAMALDVEIKQNSIDVQTGTKCVKITSEGAYGEKDGETKLYPADTVVNALGLKARDREAADLSLCAPEFYLIGDCNTPRNIFMTTNEATHVATDVGRPLQ
ncbi:MAG: FAD-dependent oxidoreductase, partial [Clostridiales bacterium]|nr:FAD-dependent oxidoreductase [Clostridiales bacterium]